VLHWDQFMHQLHQVQDVLETQVPCVVTDKRLRREATRSVHADETAGRWFHPSCLGRDPAGANVHTWYGMTKDTGRCLKRDQTHKLCGDCLKSWCDGDGEVPGEVPGVAGVLARNVEEGKKKNWSYYCIQIRMILPLELNVQLQIFAPKHPEQTD
jgi:hypothetical protein